MTGSQVLGTLEVVMTAGDPQGIGPEVAARAAIALTRRDPDVGCVVVGARESLATWLPDTVREVTINCASTPGLSVLSTPATPLVSAPPSAAGGRAALAALEAGFERVRAAPGRALVTAPVSKEAIAATGIAFSGHTGWLAEQCGCADEDVVMLFTADELRVALATVHVPLSRVAASLTIDGLVRTLTVVEEGLRKHYGVSRPRIAVLGLNPHAGEGGLLGREEAEVLAPAIARRVADGALVEGPFGADGYFGALQRAGEGATPGGGPGHDVVLAMYHDQGLLPIKALAFGRTVNVSLGLPIIRTSVDHGCAWGLAGTGRADAGSMEVAGSHALSLLRNPSG